MPRNGSILATVIVVVSSSWSCSSTAPDVATDVTALAVVVSPASSTLSPDAQLPLQAQLTDESGAVVSGPAFIWTVQDPRIVSVSEDGVVTALAVGTSQVAASALGKSGLATITVKPGAVATVAVTAPSNSVKVGSTIQLTATATDAKGNQVPNQSFVWSSSSPSTATVSGSGVVAGKRRGSVTITATTGGKSGSLLLNVN